jgi:hypothetical protein
MRVTRDGRTLSRTQEQWNASFFRPTAAAVDVRRLPLGVVVYLELAQPSSFRPIQDGSGAEDGWPARYVGW